MELMVAGRALLRHRVRIRFIAVETAMGAYPRSIHGQLPRVSPSTPQQPMTL